MTALDVATGYVAKGWNPVPLPFKQKRPVDVGWQHRRIATRADVERYFDGKQMNIGAVLGPSSHGLTDVDLDCDEAIVIAPAVLPPTKAIFGRASARASHRLYYHPTLATTVDKATLQLKDPTTDGMLLEVRVGGGDKGAQTVFPGSVHESGEPITWEESGEPALVDDDLVHRAKVTAALCLLARYWPKKQPGGHGSRHDAALTVGGFLARCGFKLALVKHYTEFVARAANDEEPHDRIRAAADSVVAYQKGDKTRGYPALKDLFGDKIADRVADWLGYQGARDDGPSGIEASPSEPVVAMPYAWKAAESLASRQWLYGRRLVRKYVTGTVAPGGIGKSSLEIAEIMAMVSGKPLLGIMPPRPLRVWLWNLEDTREETERHIQATAKFYGLTPDDIGDRLYVNCARETPLVIATTTRDKAVIVRPVVDSLIAEIIKNKIDVVVIDPFVSCHQVTENDNNAMDMIAKEWGRVAERGNCAVELVHHARKGEAEITVDSSRGGSALADALRNVRVVNRMSEVDGEKAGVANHRLYFRTYSDKATLVPPADNSDWFKLESVDLCNGPPGESDLVGVVRVWKWPDAMAGMTAADFDKVAVVIRAGKWRESSQAEAWVGYAVAKALGLNADNKKDRSRILGMLKVWFGAGSLIKVEGLDEARRPRMFIEVKES